MADGHASTRVPPLNKSLQRTGLSREFARLAGLGGGTSQAVIVWAAPPRSSRSFGGGIRKSTNEEKGHGS